MNVRDDKFFINLHDELKKITSSKDYKLMELKFPKLCDYHKKVKIGEELQRHHNSSELYSYQESETKCIKCLIKFYNKH